MAEKRSEIVIQFKSVPHNIFDTGNRQKNNQLVIRLQPEESIKLKIMIKKPSASGFHLQELPLDLLFDDYYDEEGCRNIKTTSITSEFDIEKVTFEPFMNSYGDVIKNWATIYLRTKDYE